MPDHEDSLGGETFSGEEPQDPAEQSLGDGATMGGDTAAHNLGDQSTFGDANGDDELFDDGMELVDLSTRYTEEGVLGKGGMGEVILATDTRLGRKVAIKRILGKAARSKIAVQRFLTEAKSIAGLSHNNIVQIYDYGRATDGPFLIMECVQGGSLLDLSRKGPIELDEAVKIFSQVCDGLNKAHAAGIIHRDIKPANILITEDGVPKLTDFGLAKDDTADTGMTMEGAVIGTLDFMPPEQRQAAELTDHRSDLWSLAATFYQMLTGEPPRVIDLDSVTPSIRPVLVKALKSKKEDRFQSAMEMREAILQAHSGKMDTSRSLGEGECPQCAAPNPSHGKFCVGCGAALQIQCLKCKVEIQIWNQACGECGSLQEALVEKKLSDLKEIHDEAESLLAELELDAAEEKAVVIANETDSRLQQFATWHDDFSARLESSRTSEHTRLEELLRTALTHEQAHDYKSGLRTIAQVPSSLRRIIILGISGTAGEIDKRLTKKHSRLKELEGFVRERVSKREIAGLLPIVNELLSLKPDRPELIKLEKRLGLREESIAARNQDIVVKAKQYISSHRFSDAISALNSIPEIERTDEIKSLIEQAEAYATLREISSLALAEAEESGTYGTAIEKISSCLAEIAKTDIPDPQIQQMLDKARGKASASIRNWKLVKLGIVAACVVVVLIIGVVIKINLDAQTAKKAYAKKAPMIADALAKGNWYLVLVLDPDNSEGLQMKAAAVKQAAVVKAARDAKITAALARGDWKAVLALDPDNSDGLRRQVAAEKAVADMEVARKKAAMVTEALSKRNWQAVLALDPNNKDGLRLKIETEEAAAEVLTRAPITNSQFMKLKLIPAGNFLMGQEMQQHADPHMVTISRTFYMQTTEVTQGQWKAVMGTEPWKDKNNFGREVKEGSNYAASWVIWDDAVEFCKKLSVMENKTYRLPTEAEWEYACRAGTTTTWSFGNDEASLGDYAWYSNNAGNPGEQYAHQVGLKRPNAWGLYDMHGNVWEWCHDYFGWDYYQNSPETDPQGPPRGNERVHRGGAFYLPSGWLRLASHSGSSPETRSAGYGFRVVQELD